MKDPFPFADQPDACGAFEEPARKAVYEAIALRRDVRHFVADREVSEETLERILGAAHQAPSVGLSQPWGFVVVRDRAVRGRIRESFLRAREAEAARFPPHRREEYLALRLEGILEAPLNVCVAVDFRPPEEAILGTTVQPEAVRASALCATQNLWLAARAEGVGVGWVSIVEPSVLRAELGLPPGVEPVSYLCVGYPRAFRQVPMLEEVRWRARRPLAAVVHPGGRWEESGTLVPPELEAAVATSSFASSPTIPEPSRAHEDEARRHQGELAKPPGSLGALEGLAVRYAGLRARFPVRAPSIVRLVVFAGDHGVTAEGVSAYGSRLTEALVANVLAGGAAVSVLAREHRVPLVVVDAGVFGPLDSAPLNALHRLVRAKVRPGTRNLRHEDALTRDEALACLALGEAQAREAAQEGVELLGCGELGIGNTTAGAALLAAFLKVPAARVVGNGTGLDEAARRRKIQVVEDALARLEGAEHAGDAMAVAAAVGGLELLAQAGLMLGAARARVPVVIDGYLGLASALVARALDPNVVPYLVASHRPSETGAALALESLGLLPLVDLGMRLGEGTGSVLGMALVRSAVALQDQMATFATAGVVR